MPPPSVSPPTPVVEMKPLGTARPKAWVAWSTSPQCSRPRRARSARLDRRACSASRERSMTRPSSQMPRPRRCVRRRESRRAVASRGAKLTARDDVGHIGAARDQRGMLVDHAVVDLARLLVARVAGLDQLSAQATLAVRWCRGRAFSLLSSWRRSLCRALLAGS